MDGLECSEIRVSEILADNEENRIDSEYYKKEYLVLYKKLKYCENLGTLAKMHDVTSNGSFEKVHDILNDNNPKKIPYIRSGDVGETFLDPSGLMRISEEAHKNLPLSQTTLYDVMMARKGKIGGATIITEQEVGYNCNENVIKLTINDRKKYNPYYVTTYFNSYYGKKQIERLSTGNVQPWASIYQMKKLRCPYMSTKFQSNVEETLSKAYGLLGNAKKSYYDAEKILLANLGMKDFSSTEETVAVKNLSQSFGETGRLDAEYYQPKYETYIKSLNTTETVSALCNIYDENYNPLDETDYHYIELANVGAFGNILDVTVSKGKCLPTRARRRVKAGQVIVSSIEGSLQSCALITDEYDGALCSTGFYVLDSNVINPETLLVLFKSKVMQELMKQRCSGTILTAISKHELLSMPLPEIAVDIQKEIAKEIQSSFILRHRSKQLLDCAVQAVEIAIEQNEEKATAWLEEKIKETEKA